MVPLIDEVGTKMYVRAYVTLVLVTANVVMFIWLTMQMMNGASSGLIRFGLVPARLFNTRAWMDNAFWFSILPLFVFMFIHCDLMHLLANMLFLWVFGRAVEGQLGSTRFVLLYIASGLASGIGHALMNAKSTVPVVGASGAIAGILGAYLVMFPRSWVLVFIPPAAIVGLLLAVPFALIDIRLPRWAFGVIWLPTVVVLPYWFLLQVINALRTLNIEAQSNIAWWAHIAGFVFGIWLVYQFKRGCIAVAQHHN